MKTTSPFLIGMVLCVASLSGVCLGQTRPTGDVTAPELKVLVFMAGQGETGKLQLVAVDAELRRPFRLEELVRKVRDLLGDPV